MSLAGCQREHTRLDQGASFTTTAPTTTTTAPPQDESFSVSAPKFRTGRYSMVSTNTTEEVYSVNGSTYLSYYGFISISYDLDISVDEDGSATAVFTYTNVSENAQKNYLGSESYNSYSTDDQSAMTEYNSSSYQLIGKSFSVSIDSAMNITNVAPDDALAELAAAGIVQTERLTLMALDLFYPMPDTIASNTSWQFSSVIPSTYAADKLQDDMLVISVKGEETDLPYVYENSEKGYTITYDYYPAPTGSLWINISDRAIQEMNSYETRSGIYTDSSGSYDYHASGYSICAITSK